VPQIQCSFIIVNWNSLQYLRDCLKSIHEKVTKITYEIIVVDNASYDGSAKFLFEKYPHVLFIQSEKNLGFSGANNLGAEKAKGQVYLFLNPDTEIRGDAIELLYTTLFSDKNYGAIGCRLLNTDGSLQTSSILPFPSLFNLIFDAESLKQLTRMSKQWGIAALYRPGNGPWTVEAISGACLMIKSEVFHKVDGFSKDYFMFAEDIDICYKIHTAGYANMYLPSALVVHHGGGATAKKKVATFSIVLQRDSMYLYLRKFRGNRYAMCYRISIGAMAILRTLFFLCISPLSIVMRSRIATNGLIKWSHIFSWSIGKENWVKEVAFR
jgi:GT2 family glycosyltransferase